MVNSGFGIQLFSGYRYENDLDVSNTIDAKAIYYWVNHRDEAVPSDAAYVVLVSCANIRMEGISPKGIALASTTSSAISRVKMTGRSDGINLLDCSNITIADSILRDQGAIRVDSSSNNIVRHNEFSNQNYLGIRLGSGSGNLISGNTFTNISDAIHSMKDVGNGNIVVSNNFTANEYALTVRGSVKVLDNVFDGNAYGILFSEGSGSIVTGNIFKNNEIGLSFSGSSSNFIYLNNFIDNDRQVTDAGVSEQSASTQASEERSGSTGSLQLAASHVSGVNFMPPPPPSSNIWDNGAEGNYWSDYTGSDKNGDGIGDSSYDLYGNNQDHFPLMKPVAVSEVPSPPNESSLLAPAGSPSQEPEPTEISDAEVKPEPFPMLVIATAFAASTAVVVGLIVIFKKRNRQVKQL